MREFLKAEVWSARMQRESLMTSTQFYLSHYPENGNGTAKSSGSCSLFWDSHCTSTWCGISITKIIKPWQQEWPLGDLSYNCRTSKHEALSLISCPIRLPLMNIKTETRWLRNMLFSCFTNLKCLECLFKIVCDTIFNNSYW